MSLKILKLILILASWCLLFLTGAIPAAAQYWPDGCLYRRTITIDHTRIPNTDQANFPVLISGTYSYLATTANGGDVTSANGYDILFTSDANGMNLLPFEQESYNPSTGAMNYWVKVPTVSQYDRHRHLYVLREFLNFDRPIEQDRCLGRQLQRSVAPL